MKTPQRLSRTARRAARRSIGLAGIAMLLGTQVHAVPLHRCHVDGKLVVQAAPCATEGQVAAPELRPTLIAAERAEDAAAPPKKRTLADIMRDREAENRARPKAREPQIDGARILRDRMGAL